TQGVARCVPSRGGGTGLAWWDPKRQTQVADRYRLLRPLGRGGMAEVYLARDERLRREVALKRLSPAVADDAESWARFQREARIAAAVTHPNVAGVVD